MMMFVLGLLGTVATSTKLVAGKKQKIKSTLFVVRDDNNEERFVIRPN
jgi:hypothetical protein